MIITISYGAENAAAMRLVHQGLHVGLESGNVLDGLGRLGAVAPNLLLELFDDRRVFRGFQHGLGISDLGLVVRLVAEKEKCRSVRHLGHTARGSPKLQLRHCSKRGREGLKTRNGKQKQHTRDLLWQQGKNLF